MRPWIVCNAGGCSHFRDQDDVEASEVGMKRVGKALLRNSIVFYGTETTVAVYDGQRPSYWTPTGCPCRRAACRGARLL